MESSKSCPSYIAKPGAELFGIVTTDGQVAYLEESIKIDQTFVEKAAEHEARTGQAAEDRFRFSGKCIQGGCSQWDHEHSACSLVGRIKEALQKKAEAVEAELSPCAIRSSCRWYFQGGADACLHCNEVVRSVEKQRLDALSA